jgi:hypothetical protein
MRCAGIRRERDGTLKAERNWDRPGSGIGGIGKMAGSAIRKGSGKRRDWEKGGISHQ